MGRGQAGWQPQPEWHVVTWGWVGSGWRWGLVKGPFPGQPGNKPHGCFFTVFPQHFVPQSPPQKEGTRGSDLREQL